MIPRALQIACEEDIEFRRSLPRDYLNHMGVAYSDVVRINHLRLILLRYELHCSAQQYIMYFFSFLSTSGNASEATVHAQGAATDEQVDDVRTC